MTLRIMVDLETMSTAANAAIVSIGACANDGRPDFYARVDLQSCVNAGLHIEAATIMWWLQQSPEAQKALVKDTKPLAFVLYSFQNWLRPNNQSDDDQTPIKCELWAMPASLDVTILEQAYKALNLRTPTHALYTQPGVLRDEVPEERRFGIDAGQPFRRACAYTVIYVDLTPGVGVKEGEARSLKLGHKVEVRTLGPDWEWEHAQNVGGAAKFEGFWERA